MTIFTISWTDAVLLSGLTSITRHLDNSVGFTANVGLSVVAPKNMIVPSSTEGSRASCWALFHRWHSSTNTNVLVSGRAFLAAAITARSCFMVAWVAFSCRNRDPVSFARDLTREVLPVPGGPQNIILW